MNVILPEDAKNFPSNGIVVTAEKLASERDLITGLARAVAKAVVYSAAHDDKAFEMAASIAPEEFEDETFATHAWEAARILKKLG